MVRKMLGLGAFVATGALMLITQWVCSENFLSMSNIILLFLAIFYVIGIVDHYNEIKG